METESSFVKASSATDKRNDIEDVKVITVATCPEDFTSNSAKTKGSSVKHEDGRTVPDEKILQPVGSYEEERPINLVKKMKIEKDSTVGEYPTRIEAVKENMSEDAPIDLSSGTKRKETKESRKSAIERLRDELRNEETTLLLLKKLQRSQMVHRSQDNVKTADHPVFKSPVPSTPTSKPAPAPPPLVRGGVQPQVHQPANQIIQRPEPPRVPQYGPVTNVQHVPSMRAPPPMLSVPRPPVARATTSVEPPAAPRPAVSVTTPEQTLAQSKDAAKLALRRQLEATLLQIPPPKPAALAVNFIPSIGSNVEFVSLVGLEEVVTCIASQEASANSESGTSGNSEVRKPFQCAHCQTDYTPVWRRSQSSVDEILCERCAITAQKRMLKQEHTARLKAAFMHALQQEREIEASCGLPPSASLPPARPPAIVSEPKLYSGLNQQHSRSVPSFHTMTDPRILPVSAAPYGLISGQPRQQFGTFPHRSDHQLAKRMN